MSHYDELPPEAYLGPMADEPPPADAEPTLAAYRRTMADPESEF
jgi:hypothetical protein